MRLIAPPFEATAFSVGETDHTDRVTPEIDLEAANELLRELTPEQRFDWGYGTFGERLAASTSCGIDAANVIDLVARSARPTPAIFVNTGFLFDLTLEHRDRLERTSGVQIIEFGPSQKQIDEARELQLWRPKTEVETGDPQRYSEITKLEPMSRAIKELGIKALISGVRRHQTPNRATLDFINFGNDGEYRINIFLDWSKSQVDEHFEAHNLLRHPMYFLGYESVGDVHSTRPGKGREGRGEEECGINSDGKVIRNDQWFNP